MANAPTDAPIDLTDDLFAELRSGTWPLRKGSLLHAIARKLALVMDYSDAQIAGLYERLETKVLFGIDDDDGPSETLVGWMHGIMPGIVLFTNALLEDDPLAGLFQRGSDGRFYQVRTFEGRASVQFYDSSKLSGSGWTRCPAFMVGSMLGSQVLPTVGFTPHRWAELQPWLKRWLPKTA